MMSVPRRRRKPEGSSNMESQVAVAVAVGFVLALRAPEMVSSKALESPLAFPFGSARGSKIGDKTHTQSHTHRERERHADSAICLSCMSRPHPPFYHFRFCKGRARTMELDVIAAHTEENMPMPMIAI
ncbi:hypothetical protein BO70DRAFT_19367 [Aspergillus heteromorphus CBS 117.55]|uniref:Uncharacterized protein n=1 Tax=Aspergillus heteromorphus CBS 117.55 TaxID=1448321 RepID=A0A317X598_9EURO|nr:uncharacterized protein BO70DRAFT_19367 [Aspergillus heteromorphus CBS 117.55]PWY92792.1 hypothetical protein BO70DRAFT_19367 [Aspergillus heteromorphus CBS 117.55]